MTQSPRIEQTGQNAPASTDSGSANQSRKGSEFSSTPISSSQWSGPSAGGSTPPAFADAPTGIVPPVSAPAAPPRQPPQQQLPRSAPQAERQSRVARNRGPRRARLQLRHINPWTVLKFSCVLSIALFFVWLIVVGVLFGVLDGAGVIDKINSTITTINGPGSNPPVTAGIVFGGAAIIGVVNIVLFIALSTVGSIVYNLCADLVGGIEITLSER